MPTAGLVTIIGDLVEDIVVWTAGRPRRGTDNPSSISRSRGGSGANVAVAAAVAGAPVRFIGRVGDDRAAGFLEQDLISTGTDVRLQRGGRTGCVVVLVDPDGERTMYADRAAAGDLGPVPAADLAGTAVLHLPLYGFLEPVAASHLRAAAATVRANGGAVSIDLSAASAIEHLGAEAVATVIGELQPAVVFANVEEAAAAGLSTLVPPTGGCFVIKAGARPATLVHAGGTRETVAADAVDGVRDTTGAGDVFAGTFLARWASGATAAEACVAGHRAAAATLGVAGAPTAAVPIGGRTS